MGMARKVKKNVIKKLGLKFIPKYLTIEEIKYVKGFIYDPTNTRLKHKNGDWESKWLKIYQPSNFSKEVWAIIFNMKPSELNNTYNKNNVTTIYGYGKFDAAFIQNDMIDKLVA